MICIKKFSRFNWYDMSVKGSSQGITLWYDMSVKGKVLKV